MDICSGRNYQTEDYKSRLTCWYDSSRSHYFGHINPLKVELLNQEPLLIQFYDIIGDKWTNDLLQKSYTKLRKEAPLGSVYTTPRIASYAYLSDEELVDTPISRRIELIVNLNVVGRSASDYLQITSYATGGHVGLHYDSFGLNSSMPEFYMLGDRVSTFLIYLNEVEQGGYTSFPVLRTHAKPVKGSALLYYISLKNGDTDERMMHEACPVLLGHKWIASKSTYLNANFLKRPCDLDPSM